MVKNASTGLIKTNWANVRKRIQKIEPNFANIVDDLDPDESFPLYLAYYPYGALDADTQSSLFPDDTGGYYLELPLLNRTTYLSLAAFKN